MYLNKLKIKINFLYTSIALISVGIFTVSAYRAMNIAVTIDEGITYVTYASKSFWDILFSVDEYLANNHILNTILIKVFTSVFGNAELSLRIPALIGCVLFLIYSAKISIKLLKNKILALALFIFLNANIIIFDLFSIARGYSLMLGFLLLGIYLYLNFIENSQAKLLRLSFISFFLASFANFAAFNYFLSFITIHFIFELVKIIQNKSINTFIQKIKIFLKNNLLNLFFALILSLPLLILVYRLKLLGEAYFGGSTNFISDTVFSLANVWSLNNILILGFIAFILLLFIYKFKEIVKDKRQVFLIYSLAILIAVINVQFYLLKTPLPIERTAVYIYPLIAIFIFIVLSKVSIKRFSIVSLVLSIILFVLMISKITLNSSYLWWFNAYDKDASEYLISLNANSVNVHWYNYRSVNYYLLRSASRVKEVRNPSEIVQDYQYFYSYKDSYEIQTLNKNKWKLIKEFGNGETFLYKNQSVN